MQRNELGISGDQVNFRPTTYHIQWHVDYNFDVMEFDAQIEQLRIQWQDSYGSQMILPNYNAARQTYYDEYNIELNIVIFCIELLIYSPIYVLHL